MKTKIAVILILFFALTSCGAAARSSPNVSGGHNSVAPNATNGAVPQSPRAAAPVPGAAIIPAAAETDPRVLDTAALDRLDNTRVGWGIKLETDGKIPELPQNMADVMAKYGALYTMDTTKNIVYLTFDCGYENGYTPMILDALKTNGVKAVFFVTEQYVRENDELIKRMINEGHEIGNHSSTHPDLTKVSYAKYTSEIKEFGVRFYDRYKAAMRYMRPPEGVYSERVLAAAQMLGYKCIFWDFAYLDYDVNKQRGVDYAVNKIQKHLHNGSVLLLHAVSRDNAEGMNRIIKTIRASGYEIGTFDF